MTPSDVPVVPTPADNPQDTLSTEVVAGIVVGGLVSLLIIAAIAIAISRRKKTSVPEEAVNIPRNQKFVLPNAFSLEGPDMQSTLSVNGMLVIPRLDVSLHKFLGKDSAPQEAYAVTRGSRLKGVDMQYGFPMDDVLVVPRLDGSLDRFFDKHSKHN
jgi:hypothetical protein